MSSKNKSLFGTVRSINAYLSCVCELFLSPKLQNIGAPNTHARDILIDCCKLCKTSHPVVWNIKTAARFVEALCAIFPWRRGNRAQGFSESRCLPWARESVHFYEYPQVRKRRKTIECSAILFRVWKVLIEDVMADCSQSSGEVVCLGNTVMELKCLMFHLQ